jgi:hypothetical protein
MRQNPFAASIEGKAAGDLLTEAEVAYLFDQTFAAIDSDNSGVCSQSEIQSYFDARIKDRILEAKAQGIELDTHELTMVPEIIKDLVQTLKGSVDADGDNSLSLFEWRRWYNEDLMSKSTNMPSKGDMLTFLNTLA